MEDKALDPKVSVAKNQVKKHSGYDKWMASGAAVQPKSRFL